MAFGYCLDCAAVKALANLASAGLDVQNPVPAILRASSLTPLFPRTIQRKSEEVETRLPLTGGNSPAAVASEIRPSESNLSAVAALTDCESTGAALRPVENGVRMSVMVERLSRFRPGIVVRPAGLCQACVSDVWCR